MKTAKSLLTTFLLSTAIAGFSQVELKGDGISDGNYQAPKADKITIDGTGAEKSWQKAQWKEIKYTWLGDDIKKEDFQGRYKLLWDADHLYFLVEVFDDSLSDQEPDPFVNWWEDDCLELFIDEDRSKGGHQFSYNAFAYHITLDYDAIDLGPDKQPKNFKDHLQVKRTKNGKVYTWEVAMKVYNDKFKGDGKDVPVKLNEGKVMGFAVSYNDNDGDNRRENFIGSVLIPGEGDDRNKGWIDAGVFGEVKLVK